NAILYSFDKRLSLQGSGIDNWVKNARHVLHGVIDTVAKPAAGNTQPPPVPAEPQPLASDAPPD
ncbi:MAG: hypothetical protein VB912_03215, partial [Pirellulaceae bacterium]